MDEDKLNLKGSPNRDIFKQMHKQKAPGSFYACDLDFILIAKYPARIVACLDFKLSFDQVTFAEVIAYNELIKYFPVYIIKGRSPNSGPFAIQSYKGGDFRPNPPLVHLLNICYCDSWDELVKWEESLREIK